MAVETVPIDTAIGCDGDWTFLIDKPSGKLMSTVMLIYPGWVESAAPTPAAEDSSR
jgi:hypothetical protein